jgi:FeS assembly SUF system regulator
MLRMSKLTDYGTMVLAQLATTSARLATAGQVADATRIAQPTVSKLLKALARAGLVVSERGAAGGYALARPPEQISAADIIDALEGPVAITECSAAGSACDLEQFCRVGNAWQIINQSIRHALRQVSLTDLQIGARAVPTPDLQSPLRKAATANQRV